MSLFTYEQRLDSVALAAWETWTENGLGLDEDEHVQTDKSARDAATNVYVEGMDDMEWLSATLKRLQT